MIVRVAGMCENRCGCGIGNCDNTKCERFVINVGPGDVKGNYLIDTQKFDVNNTDIIWGGAFSSVSELGTFRPDVGFVVGV